MREMNSIITYTQNLLNILNVIALKSLPLTY